MHVHTLPSEDSESMFYPSPPQLTGTTDRAESGDTIDSPFSSNLVTPTDEDPHEYRGIYERITGEGSVVDYFNETVNDKAEELRHANDVPTASQSSVVNETSVVLESCLEDKETHSMNPIAGLSTSISSFSSLDSLRNMRSETIYNLPNDHILIEGPSTGDIGDNADPNSAHLPQHGWECNGADPLIRALSDSLFDHLFLGLRIVFFLPWCVAVGGCLIAFPAYLNLLAFGTGYLKPVNEIRQFSHWATYGFQHVVSFFVFLGALVWKYPNVGFAVGGVILGQFYLVWRNFFFDPAIPLGQDVQQTAYILLQTVWLDSDFIANIKKAGDAYYWGAVSDSGELTGNFE
ncbi:hypothetical protein CVT26_004030 [Gymnopilus dilepis]|uniref:Uncharacterized protein n=1 Tax=Gymnopilus dilepis TaxID=231916 RepID=A0A409W1Z5_9AGAR|nr:hypothetical protein CVT26_004030 [Gymnopilus dilepis]